MSEITNGGPALPIPDERDPVTGCGIMQGSPGMSLRDWFAGQAMAALLSDPKAVPGRGETAEAFAKRVARAAHGYADAMLIARKEPKP